MLRHKRSAHVDALESPEEGELSESAKEEKQTYSHDDNKYLAHLKMSRTPPGMMKWTIPGNEIVIYASEEC